MEIRPTFFSLAGFLVPGIVLVTTTLFLVRESRTWIFDLAKVHDLAPGASTAGGFLLTAFVVTVALSFCFVIGTFLSELFLIIVRLCIRGRLAGSNTNEYSTKLLSYGSLNELLKNDLKSRESFALQNTTGLDLYWFAGRNRMVGASGFSCVLASLLGIFAGAPTTQWGVLLIFGIIAMAVAAYRMKQYDDYVTATAATLYWLPRTEKREKDH